MEVEEVQYCWVINTFHTNNVSEPLIQRHTARV